MGDENEGMAAVLVGERPEPVESSEAVVKVRGARSRGEDGITTAEYAVGTAAGAGLAGVLYTLLTTGLGEKLLTLLIEHVLKLLGVG